MTQQSIDFIGGGFKLTLPYTFGGWFLWVLGLGITGFGAVAAMSDPVGLAVSVIGLVVLAMASPGSMSACLLYTSPSPRDYAASRMPSSA